MSLPTLTTSKMPGETQQQYSAWLLYCEAGSIDKLIRQWNTLNQNPTKTQPEFEPFLQKLGDLPNRWTIVQWSKRYRWVQRTDLKLTEDVEAIREKIKKITSAKKHKVAENFERIINRRLKQLRDGEMVTNNDLKQAWEMLRTELGETISKHELDIREEDQKPPTGEEMAGIEDISQAFKAFYEQQWKRPGKEAGHLLGNKKQDKK